MKPEGHLILADIQHQDSYTQQLKAPGFKNISVTFNPTPDKILPAISDGPVTQTGDTRT